MVEDMNLRIPDGPGEGRSFGKRGIVIRHAQRENVDELFPGSDSKLTEEGKVDAGILGKEIVKFGPLRFFSSPVTRCLETAEAIIDEIGKEFVVQKSSMLGDPGPFVIDPEETWKKMVELGDSFIGDWLRGELDSGIILTPEDGTKLFGEWIKDMLNETETGLDIFITHDLIVTSLIAEMFDYDINEKGVIGFLDGFVILMRDGNDCVFIFENETSMI